MSKVKPPEPVKKVKYVIGDEPLPLCISVQDAPTPEAYARAVQINTELVQINNILLTNTAKLWRTNRMLWLALAVAVIIFVVVIIVGG